MKKTLKILIGIILIILFILSGIYLYITDFGKKGILSNEPRNPKMEVPITYNISWWSYQEDLTIENLEVNIIESKLNLFNSKSLISYTIKGKLNHSALKVQRLLILGTKSPLYYSNIKLELSLESRR